NVFAFFFSSRRRHTRSKRDWSSDVCSSDLRLLLAKQRKVDVSEAKNYQKQKQKVARLHEKVKNQRNDFLNKLSTNIIKNHDVIRSEERRVGKESRLRWTRLY